MSFRTDPARFLWLKRQGTRLAVLLMTLSASVKLADAHTTSISYSEILIQERTVQVRLRLNLYEVNFAAQLDGNADRVLSEAEVRSNFPIWVHRVFDCVQIVNRGESGKGKLVEFHFKPDTGALECLLSYSFSQVLEEVMFRITLHTLTDSGHLNLALIQYDAQQEQRFFNLENTEARIEVLRGGMSFLRLWARWLLIGGNRLIKNPEGIAFLLGLLLVGDDLKSRAKVTGAFLSTETLTFLLGVFKWFVLPQKFCDSAIALSVAYISIENLLIRELSNRWLIALFFGCIYGFSFSSPVSLAPKSPVLSSMTMSLGIILAVAIVALLLSWLVLNLRRFRFHKKVVIVASMVLMSFGFLSFAHRTF